MINSVFALHLRIKAYLDKNKSIYFLNKPHNKMNKVGCPILTSHVIDKKIKRIAYEIYEKNCPENYLFIGGLQKNGGILSQRIIEYLEEISDIQITYFDISGDPNKGFKAHIEIPKLENQVLIIVDDVSNTGRTLAYALAPFLQIAAKKIQIAVLIDRKYQCFPIAADYVGYSLSTTFHEHIEVNLESKEKSHAFFVEK